MARAFPIVLVLAALTWYPTSAPAIKRNPSREATGHPEAVLITAHHARTHKTLQGCGVLIGPRVVLTAAHCAAEFDSWVVVAPYAKSQRVRVREAKTHPKYQPGKKENDLAVLILEEAIDTGAKPPTLHGGELLPIETKLTVVGRVANGSVSGDKLLQATVTLVGDRTNANVYGGNPQVCEHGDSGGPVYLAGKDHEVVAVISGMIEESRANVRTDIFVPITRANKEWILRQVPKEP